MSTVNKNEQTICALATPSGSGAISIVRLSGSAALDIILLACPGLALKKIESHRVYFTKFKNNLNENIDEVLVTYFANKKSYTGETSVEISGHGNALVVEKILNRLYQLGARSAERGEFTYRAFMNDKIDLVQAEAVLSLIEAQSEGALRVSLRQLEGHASEQFLNMESEIIWCLAHIEASIDFSTEGLDVVDEKILIKKITQIKEQLEKTIATYSSGKILKEGLKIVFTGQPNVGKSSLLNQVVEKNKAIVTSVAGTTRDVIEAATIYKNIKMIVCDTAGLRDTKDVVEKIGIEKSLAEATTADVCLFVFDGSKGFTTEDEKLFLQMPNQFYLFIANKWDTVSVLSKPILKEQIVQKIKSFSAKLLDTAAEPIAFVSALDLSCRDIVLGQVMGLFNNLDFLNESIISSARQFEMSQDARLAISAVLQELGQKTGSEFVAQTLKSALLSVQKILGHSFDDQVMDRVFKEFCIGK